MSIEQQLKTGLSFKLQFKTLNYKKASIRWGTVRHQFQATGQPVSRMQATTISVNRFKFWQSDSI